jgi:hypothetical protein
MYDEVGAATQQPGQPGTVGTPASFAFDRDGTSLFQLRTSRCATMWAHAQQPLIPAGGSVAA